MSKATDFLEVELLDHVLNGLAYASPASLWLALSTSTITDAGAITEPSGGSYARAPIVGSPRFTVTSGPGTAVLAQDAEFPEATAGWGTIVDAAVFDASSGGNMLLYGTLTTPRVVVAGEIPRFAASSVTFTLA